MSFEIQHQIKQNAQQIRQYVSDLYDWENEMNLKEKARTKLLKQQREKEQQIATELQKEKEQQQKSRNEASKKNEQTEQSSAVTRQKDLVRDSNTIKDYYTGWDQFNKGIDKELEKLQEEELRPYRPYNPYENSQNYIRAKPKAKVNVNVNNRRTAIIDPSELKDKGNLHYKVCEYDRAIEAYTQCVEKLQELDPTAQNNKLKCVVLSNRAMVYMKINERSKALKDCTDSLIYDGNYVKSYLRRADCHRKLGNLRQSLKDYQKILQLDPNDKEIPKEIRKIESYLQKQAKDARESLIVSSMESINNGVIPGSYRIPIEQVDEFEGSSGQETEKDGSSKDTKKKATTTNYLEEL